jgi:hypothetical protein
VGRSSLKRYVKLAEQGLHLAPKTRPGSRPKMNELSRIERAHERTRTANVTHHELGETRSPRHIQRIAMTLNRMGRWMHEGALGDSRQEDSSHYRARRSIEAGSKANITASAVRHQPRDLFVQLSDLLGEPPVATSNGPHRQLGRDPQALGLPWPKFV